MEALVKGGQVEVPVQMVQEVKVLMVIRGAVEVAVSETVRQLT
jgi:sporulation protein YlmC with PRC-barrel domain